MLILLCRNNMIARKNQGVNPWFSFFLDSFDALARVSWEPLAAPAMSLTSLRQIRSYGFSVFRAKRAKRPRPHWGLGGLAAASRSAFAPRGALKRFGPAPPRRSTSLNKRTRVKATPGFAALAFFSLRAPVSRSAARSLVLSRRSFGPGPPPPGPGCRRSLRQRLRRPSPCGLPRAFRRRGSRLVAIAPGARCASLPPRRFFLRVLPLPFQPPPRPANLGGGRKEVKPLTCALLSHRPLHKSL